MSETAMVPSNGATQAGLLFTPEQRKMIRDSFARGASENEFAVLMEVARLRNLNPVLRQIHFVKRKNRDQDGNYVESWTYQVAIDGLRATAERTGRYDGQDEPEFEYEEKGGERGHLKFCRVKVYKKGISRPFVGIAHWSEYVQTTRDGKVTKMWAEKPHIMLAKCAEALGLRKAFPEETSGMYTEEEMAKATPAEEEKPSVKVLPAKKAVQVIEVQPEHAPVSAVASNATVDAQAEAPPLASPAQVVSPAADLTYQKLAADFIATCGAGFDSPQHQQNWWKKHVEEINALPFPLRKAVKAAFDNSGPRE